jgi:hypothetical protein
MINISVINECSVLPDAVIQAAVTDLQTQVSRDFAAAWGIDAKLEFIPKGSKPDPASWWLIILDNSDQAGALGYHDVTDQGLPLGKVFAGTDLQYGTSWTVTASHELLEMLGDPDVNLTVFVETGPHSGTLFAYEVCDACEDDSLGYTIGSTLVSDFVFPSWFETFRTSGPFDQAGQVSKPLQLLPGGYIGAYNVRRGGGWTQITAEEAPSSYASRARVGSRRERRRTPRAEWLRSRAR